MFTHMVPVRKDSHSAHGSKYELLVYQVEETGEHRIYVAKDGFGVGDIFVASQEIVSEGGVNIVEALINIAKGDIDRNEFKQY